MKDLEKKLVLRPVNRKDEKLLFEWANDPVVRQGSFNQEAISYTDHKIWFKKRLNNEQTRMWIMEDSGIPCGLVRIEKSDDKAMLHYLVAASHRGKKMASRLLTMSLEATCEEWPGVNVLAYTLPNNEASHKSLLGAGFRLREIENGSSKYCFIYDCR